MGGASEQVFEVTEGLGMGRNKEESSPTDQRKVAGRVIYMNVSSSQDDGR